MTGRFTSRLVRAASATVLAVGLPACAGSPGPLGGGIRLASGIEFDGPTGDDLLTLDLRGEDVKLGDAAGESLARFRLEDGALRIQGPSGPPSGYVAPSGAGGHGLRILETPDGRLLYLLRGEPDGDVRLEDGKGRVVYNIKKRDYGLKVERADGTLEAKIRVKDEKISVRDAEGATVFTTRQTIPPVSVACLALRMIPLHYRAGLGLAVIHWGTDRL